MKHKWDYNKMAINDSSTGDIKPMAYNDTEGLMVSQTRCNMDSHSIRRFMAEVNKYKPPRYCITEITDIVVLDHIWKEEFLNE